MITPPVERLRDELGIPGMVVMQFGFEGRPSNPHRLENHRRGASSTSPPTTPTRARLVALAARRAPPATGLPGVEPNWEMIELALSSRAGWRSPRRRTCSALGSEARMNTPGTIEGNWRGACGPAS